MFVDYESIHEFAQGRYYFSIEEIESYRESVADYIDRNYADVYVGDSYYQDELSHLNFVDDVISEYHDIVEQFYPEELNNQ